jgi:zinc transport system substrate-binding protein
MAPVRVLALLLAALCAACGSPGGRSGSTEPSVVASFYPLAFAAEEIARERASVVELTPPGVEPHDVELTARQVVTISEADLLVFVGGGFQPAVEKLAAGMGERALDVLSTPRVVTFSAKGRRGPQELTEGVSDPHVWLDPTRMAAIAGLIAERLASLDPEDAQEYRRNARKLAGRLRALDRAFARGLADCAHREIVTTHQAFGYLAERYGLTQIGVAGLDPESEPSPRRVAAVTQFVREHGVTTIFFESLVSSRAAETIAAEAGVGTGVLDPLETRPSRTDYFGAMRSNLGSLRAALQCK